MAAVTVNATAFASTSLQSDVAENEAQWQVAANANFSPTLFDTWFQSTYVTSYTFDPGTAKQVQVRVRYRDNYGEISAWSAPLTITLSIGTVTRGVPGVNVVIPEPGEGYHRDNEAQFRKTVERAFQDTQQLILHQGKVRNFQEWKYIVTLADDEEQEIPTGGQQAAGLVRVATWQATAVAAEGGMWLFGGNDGDGVVTKLSGSTNTAATDSDTDLCVYTPDGIVFYVKNRLGESVQTIIDVMWR